MDVDDLMDEAADLLANPPTDGQPNVTRALLDMARHVIALGGTVTAKEMKAIRDDAVTTENLMIYSDLVADTKHPLWQKLDTYVGAVLRATVDVER